MYWECPVCGAPYGSVSAAEECAQEDDAYERSPFRPVTQEPPPPGEGNSVR